METTEEVFKYLVNTFVNNEGDLENTIQHDFKNIDLILLDKLLIENRLDLLLYPLLKNAIYLDREFLNNFKDRCNKLIYRNLQQQKTILKLTNEFKRKNIENVLFKGIILNKLLYGNNCARYSKDIDILVSEKKLITVHKILLNNGFNLYTSLDPIFIMQEQAAISPVGKDFVYVHDQENIMIEVHYKLTYIGNLGIKPFEEHYKYFIEIFGNNSVSVLKTEHHFIYLCVHGSFHHWKRLQWLIDIAILYKKFKLDFELIYWHSKKHDCLLAVIETKELLKKWFGLNLDGLVELTNDSWYVKWHLFYVNLNWKNFLISGNSNKMDRQKIIRFLFNIFLFKKNKNRWYCLKTKLFYKMPSKMLFASKISIWFMWFFNLFRSRRYYV